MTVRRLRPPRTDRRLRRAYVHSLLNRSLFAVGGALVGPAIVNAGVTNDAGVLTAVAVVLGAAPFVPVMLWRVGRHARFRRSAEDSRS